MRFDEFDFNYDLLDALDSMRFEECTPIQEQSIPLTMDGRDIIAVAQTGTGKTAAYLLPVLNRIADGELPDDAVNCIVMAPTRELAMQIDRQLEGFGYFINCSSLAVYGGTDGATFAQQQKSLLLGADIVIATPGRLLAHLQLGKIDLSRLSYFILDEADRMLDMGFYDDIMQVVKHLPVDRQTLMFSATMPPKIQQLAKNILRDPAEVKIAVSRPADKIRQQVAFCYEATKNEMLKNVLRERPGAQRVIIFASSKLNVKDLARHLRKAKFKIGEMHSDLDQTARDTVMHDFKSGHTDILVATDIVARGIDIDDITMVINYDVPHDAEDYVHRIGRTARADADGESLTLVSDRDRRRWTQIERFLGKRIERLTIDNIEQPDENSESTRRDDSRGRGNERRKKKSGANRQRNSKTKKTENTGSESDHPDRQLSAESDRRPKASKPANRRRNSRRKPQKKEE